MKICTQNSEFYTRELTNKDSCDKDFIFKNPDRMHPQKLVGAFFFLAPPQNC